VPGLYPQAGRIDFHRHSNARNSKRVIICTTCNVQTMITAAQLCAAMSLAGIHPRNLAKVPGLSLPAVQRMEANGVDTPMNASAPDAVNIDLIGDGVEIQGEDLGARRGVPLCPLFGRSLSHGEWSG
jgi:hypothetical protein